MSAPMTDPKMVSPMTSEWGYLGHGYAYEERLGRRNREKSRISY